MSDVERDKQIDSSFRPRGSREVIRDLRASSLVETPEFSQGLQRGEKILGRIFAARQRIAAAIQELTPKKGHHS